MQTTSENNIKEIFSILPDNAKVWIYQCERFLVPHEVNAINEEADRFVSSWNSHGTPLRAKISIIDNLFLIVGVDEEHAKASGCSIDKSISFVREAEKYLEVSLTNRMKVALEVDGKIIVTDLQKLSDLKQKGIITKDTIAYDNLVDTKKKLVENWKVKIGESWHKNFL